VARTEAVGTWVGLWVGLMVMGAASRTLRRPVAAMAVASIALAAAFLQVTGHLRDPVSVSEIGKTDRWMMWQAALGMIRDRPLLGHGVNTFMANYLDYWVGGERQPRYAHNCYLQVAAETGILGLAAFGWLLVLLLRRVLEGLQALAPPERLRLLGLVGALVAFLVQAGLDTNFYSLRQAALFWTLAGVAIGQSLRA
jgi:O-antigen ligase